MYCGSNKTALASQRQLADAMMRLIRQKPYAQISVSELCGKAGINRSTFYKHYGSQMDVYEEMEQDFFDAALQMLTVEEESWRTGIRQFLEFLKDEYEKVYAIIVIRPDSDFIQKVFSMPVLQYYTQKNNDPAYTERQNEYMRIYEYNGGYAVIREWVASGCKEEPAQIEDLLLHVSDYGR